MKKDEDNHRRRGCGGQGIKNYEVGTIKKTCRAGWPIPGILPGRNGRSRPVKVDQTTWDCVLWLP